MNFTLLENILNELIKTKQRDVHKRKSNVANYNVLVIDQTTTKIEVTPTIDVEGNYHGCKTHQHLDGKIYTGIKPCVVQNGITPDVL